MLVVGSEGAVEPVSEVVVMWLAELLWTDCTAFIIPPTNRASNGLTRVLTSCLAFPVAAIPGAQLAAAERQSREDGTPSTGRHCFDFCFVPPRANGMQSSPSPVRSTSTHGADRVIKGERKSPPSQESRSRKVVLLWGPAKRT